MKQFNVTQHAQERCAERLGQPEQHAKGHLITLMQTAVYRGITTNSAGKKTKVFDHVRNNVRLITDEHEATIITCYELPTAADALPMELTPYVQKKAKGLTQSYTRKARELELQAAELTLEIAQLDVNRLRAKNPQTRARIEDKQAQLLEQAEQLRQDSAAYTRKANNIAMYAQ